MVPNNSIPFRLIRIAECTLLDEDILVIATMNSIQILSLQMEVLCDIIGRNRDLVEMLYSVFNLFVRVVKDRVITLG